MRIPITRYGMPQVVLVPATILALGILLVFIWPNGFPAVLVVAAILAGSTLAFFRDPDRLIPDDPDVLLAPADGKITDITEVQEPEFIKGPALRIGIFLSVLDVHINRSPCLGRVAYIQSHPGKCFNAMHWQAASEKNQANSLGLQCPSHPAKMVLVKQITGAIARRIVCRCHLGDELAPGRKFGMIKFGSRTELFLPRDSQAIVLVKPGQSVRAGTTVLLRYQKEKETQQNDHQTT